MPALVPADALIALAFTSEPNSEFLGNLVERARFSRRWSGSAPDHPPANRGFPASSLYHPGTRPACIHARGL